MFLKSHFELFDAKMPFLEYFKHQGKLLFYVFVCGLICALMSSLLSALMGVKKVVAKLFRLNIVASGISIFLSLVLSFIGFSNFVNIVYPIIGVVNFIIFVFL